MGVANLFSSGTDRMRAVLVAFSSFAVASAVSNVPLTSDRIFPSISLFMLLSFPLAMASLLASFMLPRSLTCSNSSVK